MTDEGPSAKVTGVTKLRRGEMPKRTLGERIESLRNELGMTPSEFAGAVDACSAQRVDDWEQDGSVPKGKFILQMLRLAVERGMPDQIHALTAIDPRSYLEGRMLGQLKHRDDIAVLIDVEVESTSVYTNILSQIATQGGTIVELFSFHEGLGGKETEALLLFLAPDFETFQTIQQSLASTEGLLDCKIAFQSRDPIEIRNPNPGR